jgi:hypothetical protein
METVDPAILQALYNHVKEAPERQLADARDLDSKMVQVFGVASIVIGLAGLSDRGLEGGDAVTAILIFALLSYAAAAGFAVLDLWPREFWRSLHADTLWKEYWQDAPEKTQHALVANIASAYEHNRDLLTHKAYLIQRALVATAPRLFLLGLLWLWLGWHDYWSSARIPFFSDDVPIGPERTFRWRRWRRRWGGIVIWHQSTS